MFSQRWALLLFLQRLLMPVTVADKAEDSKSKGYGVSYHVPAEFDVQQAIVVPNVVGEKHRRPNDKDDGAKPRHKSDKTVLHLRLEPEDLP
jgi:hypothetical protein